MKRLPNLIITSGDPAGIGLDLCVMLAFKKFMANITIIGNLQARNIPVLIAANKVDLKRSNLDVIKAAFPQYEIVGVSAKYGKNIEDFYDQLFKFAK